MLQLEMQVHRPKWLVASGCTQKVAKLHPNSFEIAPRFQGVPKFLTVGFFSNVKRYWHSSTSIHSFACKLMAERAGSAVAITKSVDFCIFLCDYKKNGD